MSSFGIIGVGNVAEQYYIPALQRLGYTTIHLFDTDIERAKRVANQHSCVAFDKLDKLISKAENLIITTPPHTHFDLLQACLLPNKTILCEKPFLLKTVEFEHIQNQAKLIDCRVYVAHIRRLFASFQCAKSFLRNQPPSRLVSAQLAEGNIFHYKSISGYVATHPYGNVLADTGSHVLDAFLYVTNLACDTITIHSVEKSNNEPTHEWKSKILIDDVEVAIHLSRYEQLSNLMVLEYESFTISIPLMLEGRITVKYQNGETQFLTYENYQINYMTEAFRLELDAVFNQHAELFRMEHFYHTTRLLDTLIHA